MYDLSHRAYHSNLSRHCWGPRDCHAMIVSLRHQSRFGRELGYHEASGKPLDGNLPNTKWVAKAEREYFWHIGHHTTRKNMHSTLASGSLNEGGYWLFVQVPTEPSTWSESYLADDRNSCATYCWFNVSTHKDRECRCMNWL